MTEADDSIRDEVQQREGFDVFDFIGGRVLDRCGFRSLSDYREANVPEPVIRAIALSEFANEVESGCIHQYLFCHSYDQSVYAKESLEIIGECRLAELLGYAIPLMSDPEISADETWQQAKGHA